MSRAGVEEAGDGDVVHGAGCGVGGEFVGEHAADAGSEEDEWAPVVFGADEVAEQVDPVLVAHAAGVGGVGAAVEGEVDGGDVDEVVGEEGDVGP